MFTRIRISAALVIAVTGSLVFAAPSSPPASAAGIPDISLAVDVDSQTLHGDTTGVSLAASNGTATDGFNLSFRVVLPAGVSYAGGPVDPIVAADVPTSGETTLFFENVSDLLANNDAGLSFTVNHVVGTYAVGSSFTVSADAYVDSNPRLIPDFDPGTGLVTGDYTGWDTGSDATDIVAFRVLKTEPSPEAELVRGLHDQTTVYTVTVENNPNAPTNDFEIHDWIPGGLEFLSCGGGDNSTVVVPPAVIPEEYLGSGPINTPATGDCVVPSLVETVNSGLPAGLAAGVYTHVVWDSAGALGDVDIAAGGAYDFSYAAAIPLWMNTMAWDGVAGEPATDGAQASNIDNNNGVSTQETATELAFTNRAYATGTYSYDSTTYTHWGETTVTSEDVALQKNASTGTITAGGVTTWTVDIQVSEYTAVASSIVVTDTVPDGLEPSNPNPAWVSATEETNGTWTLVWNLADMGANGVTAVTYRTTALSHYQENGVDADPVLAVDSWENQMELTAMADGRPVNDDSSDGQSAPPPTISKEVAEPGAAPVVCGDGSAVATWSTDTAGPYGAGDRVCWRLRVTDTDLFGDDFVVQDFLPVGFTYESWSFGENNTYTESGVTTDLSGAAGGHLVWHLDDAGAFTGPDLIFEVVISSIAGGPGDQDPGDLIENLMKFSGQNTDDVSYQLRDDANAEWGEPVIGIDKSADYTVVQGGDAVGFMIAVPNTGNVEALDVQVWDALPVGLECTTVSTISGGGTCNVSPTPDRIEWTIPSIAAGGSVDITYTVTIPAAVGANEIFTNETGVRQYETPINTGTTDRFVYIPANNIDPSQEASANTDPARDDWTLFTEALGIAKTRTTEIDESGNLLLSQATIGERVDYAVTVTIPEGTTVYDGLLLDNYDENTLGYVADSAAATLKDGPLPAGPLPAGWILDDTGDQITVTYPATYVNLPDSGDDLLVLTFSATILDVSSNVRGAWRTNGATQEWYDSSGGRTRRSSTSGTRIVEPNLTISKSDDDIDGVVTPGQTVGYSLLVTNDDGISYVSLAHDLVVTDTLPGGLDCSDLSTMSHGGTCADSNPDVITWNSSGDAALLSLDPGAAITLTYDAGFPDPIVTDDTFTNTAWVGGSSTASTPPSSERDYTSLNGGLTSGYQDSDQDTLIAPQSSITKSVIPGVQTVGELVQYTVEVTLPAGTVQYDVTIIDMLPSGIDVSAPGYTVSTLCEEGVAGSGTACSVPIAPIELTPSGADVGWFLGDLDTTSPVSRVVTIVYDAFVDDAAAAVDGATLTNSVNVYANQTNQLGGVTVVPDAPNYDVSGTPATADVDVQEPNLVLTKRVLDGATAVDARRALPDEDLTYEVTLTNNGNWPAYDAAVTDMITIPSGDSVAAVSIVDGVDNGISYTVVDGDPTDGTLEWFLDGPIPAGDAVTISYTVRVWDATEADENTTGPEITNTADNPSYWAVATHTAGDGHREYAGNNDTAEVELDLASIGNYVWFDANNDGVQDGAEQPIPNATVTVTYLGSGGVVGGGDDETHVTTTDGSGLYLVEDLPGGNYTVVVSGLPSGMTPSYDLDDGTTAPDGSWVGALPENAAKRDVDFGYTGTGSIGDLVWLDRNADGDQDSDEPGIGSTEVTVTFAGLDGVAGSTDDVVYLTTTALDGSYLVEHLPAGDYTVTVTNMPLADVDPTFDLDDGTTTPDGSWVGALAAAEAKGDVDFGYNGDGLIGDTVWFDRDRDGLQGVGEPGIADVDVLLTWPGVDGVLGTPDDVTFTETTDANGLYLFVGLNSGDYSVQVDASTLPAGMDNTFDEDVDLDSQTDVVLGAGDSHLTADFGYGGSGSIGDFVWWDLNNDGVQDPGEPGIPGVDVEIVWAGADGVLSTPDDVTYVVTTDADGLYLQDNLPDGEYRVTVLGSLPSSAANTHDDDGGGDSTADVSLAGGVANLDLDFGYVGDNSIGDYVWYDADGDGVQDSAEPALSGVELTLTWAGVDGVFGTTDDVVLAPVTTDSVGFYNFPGLPDGDYRVDVTDGVPVGMAPTFDEDGGLDQTTTVTGLIGGTDHDTTDFGYNGDGLIGDTVWFDRDRDGLQGVGEPGIADVDVLLTWPGVDGVLGTPDDVTFTETTDANGLYLFVGLNSGDYSVQVDASTLPAGMDNTFDEDVDLDSQTDVVLGAGDSHLTADFGYGGSGSIGDFVWWDLNNDGVQDPGEPGIPGVDVEIVWAGADGVLSTPDDVTYVVTTDADGLYLQDNLPDGEYRVTVLGSLPSSAANTHDDDGGGDSTADVSLAGGVANLDLDFGYVGDNSIGDYVWYDADGDGVQDSAEPALSGVELTLTWAGVDGVFGTTDDVVLAPVTTDSVGFYNFPGLPDGDYRVDVTDGVPVGMAPTFDEDGGLDQTTTVTGLIGGTDHDTTDFGYNGTGTIGDTVFWDSDGDGVQGSTEPGFPNVDVTVTWSGVDGVLGTIDDYAQTVTTDADGMYLVDELPGGLYQVDVDETDLPADVVQTVDPDAAIDSSSRVILSAADVDLDQDFGYRGSSSIGDTVWFDVDGNATQGPAEPGVGDVDITVTWLGADGIAGGGDDVIFTATTDADGYYTIPGLVDGSYEVAMDVSTLPEGAVANTDLDGGDPTAAAVSLGIGEDREDVDFGVVGSASLSGIVWHDRNADGVIDPGEEGVPNAVVHVTWDGPDGPITFDVVTDATGNWSIDNLPAGEYETTIDMATVPADYVASTPEAVGVTLPPLGHESVEHGVVGSASLGSTVWIDVDGDGVVDPGEAGIDSVFVELVDVLGNVVGQTATMFGGTYLFEDLVPGTYTVRLVESTIPSGLRQTYSKTGNLDLTTTQSIAEGENVLDVNFGFQEQGLPVTGADLARLVLIGLLLVAAGGILHRSGGRKRSGR